MDAISEWLREHEISEVEALVPARVIFSQSRVIRCIDHSYIFPPMAPVPHSQKA